MSKISGLRIGHDMLEMALARAGIEAAVVGDDTRISALHLSAEPDEAVLEQLAAASGLPLLSLRVARADALPRLASGKIDYDAVKRRFAQMDNSEPETVLDLFRATFAPRQVRPEDSFVSLGGDSLRFVQLSMGLETVLGSAPANWENRTIRELSCGQTEKSRTSAVGSDLVIRALAILLVVVHHATGWIIPGGAAVMTMLIGFSLARFQWNAAAGGKPRALLSAIPLVLLPYGAALIGYALAWGEIPWASVFLVGNFGFADPASRTMLPYLFWFVELFVQSVLMLYLLFLLPAVRRLARGNAFALCLGILAFGLVLRFGLAEFWNFGGRQIFTIPWNFYLVGLGLAAAMARSGKQKLLVLAIGLAVLPAAAYYGGNWYGGWFKYTLQIPVLVALLYLPRLRLPKIAALAALSFAAAGYHIYLFHRILPEAAPEAWVDRLSDGVFVPASIVVGIAAGFAAYRVQKSVLGCLSTPSAPRIGNASLRSG